MGTIDPKALRDAVAEWRTKKRGMLAWRVLDPAGVEYGMTVTEVDIADLVADVFEAGRASFKAEAMDVTEASSDGLISGERLDQIEVTL